MAKNKLGKKVVLKDGVAEITAYLLHTLIFWVGEMSCDELHIPNTKENRRIARLAYGNDSIFREEDAETIAVSVSALSHFMLGYMGIEGEE